MPIPDKVKDAWTALADQMVEDMREKGPDWYMAWVAADPPVNGITGEPYRGRNRVLLTGAIRAYGFADPRFMTFNTAKKAGFHVRKGERSCAVIEKWKPVALLKADSSRRIPQPKTPEEWGRVKSDPDYIVKPRCVGCFSLFNASQIEGVDPYVTDDVGFSVGRERDIDALLEASPCQVSESLSDHAGYSPILDRIMIPHRSQFSTFEGFATTLLHEQAHATGSKNRLDRNLTGEFGSSEYAREELIAELASVFCAQSLGIRHVSEEAGSFTRSSEWRNHAAYLRNWASDFENPASELRNIVPAAMAASDYIIELHRKRSPQIDACHTAMPNAPSTASIKSALEGRSSAPVRSATHSRGL